MNVALGKTATQSSTYRNPGWPSNAVDGDFSNKFAHTDREFKPWWEVDLGGVNVINEIRLNAGVGSIYNKGLLVETRTKEADSWKICKNL